MIPKFPTNVGVLKTPALTKKTNPAAKKTPRRRKSATQMKQAAKHLRKNMKMKEMTTASTKDSKSHFQF